ncbi:hypothetical protein AVEN_110695-1 [Araneus ventricosus]|uniref:Uncharacterized protein n=1 Tax=Araneus ventricosus TaxID=182803 RepID=A0A4Y2AUI2_ARAVE|nr:hypothetical protein AVEN_110695-1 [Araneus ventricosus]
MLLKRQSGKRYRSLLKSTTTKNVQKSNSTMYGEASSKMQQRIILMIKEQQRIIVIIKLLGKFRGIQYLDSVRGNFLSAFRGAMQFDILVCANAEISVRAKWERNSNEEPTSTEHTYYSINESVDKRYLESGLLR